MMYTYIVKIYHTMLHPMQRCLIRNSKFQGFTTVQQNLSNITQIFPAFFKDKPCFLTNIPLNSLNLFHVSRTPNSWTHIYIHIYIYIQTRVSSFPGFISVAQVNE